jgi:hypothetical protein
LVWIAFLQLHLSFHLYECVGLLQYTNARKFFENPWDLVFYFVCFLSRLTQEKVDVHQMSLKLLSLILDLFQGFHWIVRFKDLRRC